MYPCGIKAQQGGCTPSTRQSTKPWLKTEKSLMRSEEDLKQSRISLYTAGTRALVLFYMPASPRFS